jgi:Raf kinase inhibitor-like YbhB/YbcL family protein
MTRFRMLIACSIVVSGCVTNDGRQLAQPDAPLPATTTEAPTTVPFGEPLDTLPPVTVPAFQLVTPWPNGGPIPERYTCDDADLAPALTWVGVPAGTVELAITMTDLDAAFTHWVVTGVAPSLTGLVEGVAPAGSTSWPNDFGRQGYAGPCPPPGAGEHRYLYTIHALNQQLEVADDADASEVISLLNQTAIAQSSVSGTYSRAA